ncbi:hypothetical protein GCM10027360_57470 [Amycolatopsis echigonensis]|nr:hypothetical protein [Amycolatopsis echigonensis]
MIGSQVVQQLVQDVLRHLQFARESFGGEQVYLDAVAVDEGGSGHFRVVPADVVEDAQLGQDLEGGAAEIHGVTGVPEGRGALDDRHAVAGAREELVEGGAGHASTGDQDGQGGHGSKRSPRLSIWVNHMDKPFGQEIG